jgi:hypothetical protein
VRTASMPMLSGERCGSDMPNGIRSFNAMGRILVFSVAC